MAVCRDSLEACLLDSAETVQLVKANGRILACSEPYGLASQTMTVLSIIAPD
jgi:hypothetical protein